MRELKIILGLLLIIGTFSCGNDDSAEGDDVLTDVTIIVDSDNGEVDIPDQDLLFEVIGLQDTPITSTFYFITNDSNQLIGDFITFDGTNNGEIVRPEGFTDTTFNLHQLVVRDSSETGQTGENLKFRISSFLNIQPTKRRQAAYTLPECGENLNVTYDFGDLPAHNYATIYNHCDEISRGSETSNLSNQEFEAIVPGYQTGFIHLRNGSDTAFYQFAQNISNYDIVSVDEDSLDPEMTLISPNYSVIPSLVSIRKVDPLSFDTLIARLYSYGGDGDTNEDFYNYFLPKNDVDAVYKSSVFYYFDFDDNGVRDATAYSIDYNTVTGQPDSDIIDASIGYNGAISPEDWIITGTGSPDVFQLQVTSYEEFTDASGNIVPVKSFIHRIRTNQSTIVYERPAIPQVIIDQFPALGTDNIIQNEYLQLAGQVQDYENVSSYREYIDLLFQIDGISNIESLFFTPKKILTRYFIGEE